jgi:hypothetical protein
MFQVGSNQPQYRSSGTEEPTVNIGNKYENRDVSPLLPHVHPNQNNNIANNEETYHLRNQYEREIDIYRSDIETLK